MYNSGVGRRANPALGYGKVAGWGTDLGGCGEEEDPVLRCWSAEEEDSGTRVERGGEGDGRSLACEFSVRCTPGLWAGWLVERDDRTVEAKVWLWRGRT